MYLVIAVRLCILIDVVVFHRYHLDARNGRRVEKRSSRPSPRYTTGMGTLQAHRPFKIGPWEREDSCNRRKLRGLLAPRGETDPRKVSDLDGQRQAGAAVAAAALYSLPSTKRIAPLRGHTFGKEVAGFAVASSMSGRHKYGPALCGCQEAFHQLLCLPFGQFTRC